VVKSPYAGLGETTLVHSREQEFQQTTHLITFTLGVPSCLDPPPIETHLPTDLKPQKRKHKYHATLHAVRMKNYRFLIESRLRSGPQYSARATFDTASLFLFAEGVRCCCICSKPSCCSELFPLTPCHGLSGHILSGTVALNVRVTPPKAGRSSLLSVLITSISLRGYILLDPKSC